MFYNYTNETFVCTWDGKPFEFAPYQVYDGMLISKDGRSSVFLNEVVAGIFAKHLADKVMNSPSLNVNFVRNDKGEQVGTASDQMTKVNYTNTEILIKRATTAPEISVPMPEFVSELPLMENTTSGAAVAVEAPKVETPVVPQYLITPEVAVDVTVPEKPKKRGRPAKGKEESSPSPEAEFDV